ncbi:FtsX-like permease family protein [Clostridium paraputrificum]|uniref:ABC transporter permease n=1 Tax=Clostridium paraputrificum TaxID=29363 RepID=UPI00325B07B2
MFKRACLYVTRKKGKSLIMLFILFAIATAVLSIISVKKAALITKEEIKKEVNSSFSIVGMAWGTEYTNGTNSLINEIQKLEGVSKINRSSNSGGELVGLKSIESESKVTREEDKKFGEAVSIQGSDYSELDKKFTSGSFKLVEGRHLTEGDRNKVLIHKELADLNNLKIGDKVSLKTSQYNNYNLKEDGEINLEIIGIYNSEDSSKSMSKVYMPQNTIIVDNKSVVEFDGYTEKNYVYLSTDVYINDPEKLDSIMKKVKKLPGIGELHRISTNDELFTSLVRSAENLNSIINTVLIGIIVVGIILLSLILTFWIRGRIKETGILLSIGISKKKIIFQYVMELLIIAMIGFGLSYFSGKAIAQNVGDKLVTQASEQSIKDFNKVGGAQIGPDADAQLMTKTIDSLDISVTFNEMIYVFLIGATIIVVSVIVSSIPIINLKPKDILSKMS